MKKICFAATLLVALLLCATQPIAAASKGINWYCTRQKAHRQAIAAPELRFAEELGGY